MNDAPDSPEKSAGHSSFVPAAPVGSGKRPLRSLHAGPADVTIQQDRHYWRGACEERGHIACEMHDGLFAHLNAAALRLQNATEILLNETTVTPELLGGLRGELTEVHRLLHFAVAEMRGWLRDQPPAAAVSEDLGATICRIADEVQAVSDTCRIRVAVDRELPPLSARTRWELARVGQEALRNAVRHGHARTVELRIERLLSERLVQLRIQDDGCGFDPFAAHPDGFVHFGLKAMRSRVERLGGRFSIESRLQAGTTITATIPAAPPSTRPLAGHADILYQPSLDH